VVADRVRGRPDWDRGAVRRRDIGRDMPYRGRIRCRACKRRMGANPFPNYTYYRCPHNPANPRHQAAAPDHPRTVQVPDTLLDQITGHFTKTHLFSPGRTALVAAQLPATDQDAAARTEAQAEKLRARIRKLDTAQNAQITALEDIPDGPAAPAMRARIRDRFAQLHHDRTQAEEQLAALTATRPKAADTSVLDDLPLYGDVLPGLPPALKARLFAAIDLSILWNKADGQATVTAVITDATLAALPDILNPGQDGYHDTNPTSTATIGELTQPALAGPNAHLAHRRCQSRRLGASCGRRGVGGRRGPGRRRRRRSSRRPRPRRR
jgi:hypothetical protein